MRGIVRAFALGLVLAAGAAAAQTPQIHLGVKTCANSACHGGASVNPNSKVQRNEFTFWQQKDPHSKAWEALKSDRGQRIAQNLGIAAAEEADLCLNCHATNVPKELRAIEFDITDGIQCESCHGASVGWLGIHSTGLATREQNIAAGLFPTEDPVKRADMCLDCHLGNKDQFANHRLMGAGHPRMGFELDTYTWANAHHTLDKDYVERKTFVDGVRTWAIGAAKTIERRMALLVDENTGTNGFFPEFVFFDCHGCHHPMSQLRYRPQNNGVPPGTPRINDSHVSVLEVALAAVDPKLSEELGIEIRALHKASTRGRDATIDAAKKLMGTAKRAVEVMAATAPDEQQMRTILLGLVERGAKGEYTDYPTAEQATLVINATISAMADAGYIPATERDRLQGELGKAYAAIEHDERYQPGQFVDAMKALRSAIR